MRSTKLELHAAAPSSMPQIEALPADARLIARFRTLLPRVVTAKISLLASITSYENRLPDGGPVPVDINLVVAVATLIQTAVVVAGVGFALRQIHQAKQARELESLVTIFDRMRPAERRASIEHMLTLPADIGDWREADRHVANSEHQDFEQLGFLVRHRFLRERLIMEMYSLLIIDAWRALEPYELAEQERMGTPGFGRSFKELSERATAYRLKRGMRIDGRVSRQAPTASKGS